MILTKSPYYLTIPWMSPSSSTVPSKYVLQIYVWNGLKTSVPASPNYEEENKNPLSLTGNIDINISPYINDILTVGLTKGTTTGVLDGDCAVWVKTQVIYYLGTVAQSPEFVTTTLAVKGYGYGIEGKNSTLPLQRYLLADGSNVNVSDTSQFSLAFKASETATTAVTIISYPTNNINYSVSIAATTTSSELIKKAYVKVSEALTDSYIEIKREGILIYTLNIKEELRYTPFDVYCINKYGALYPVTFFKEKINNLKVKSESYENSSGQPIDGVHQIVTYNKNGNREFKAKTGFISEANNEHINQLLLSDRVWILEGDLFNPVNITTTGIEEQTRQKNRLLNYEFDFKYAYNEINDI